MFLSCGEYNIAFFQYDFQKQWEENIYLKYFI